MKVAIMQPYFFPYIGYWQLIHSVDGFVLLDDVQYIRHGWINRNRILKHGGGWQYITIPLRKHSMTELVRNIYVRDGDEWKERIIRQLEHYSYGYNTKAPYYHEIVELLRDIFFKIKFLNNLSKINALIIKEICYYLGITTEVIISSGQQFSYENVTNSGEWALRIAEQMKAREYINPIAGASIFESEKFASCNIKLAFLKSDEIIYDQKRQFEPWLSIVDVMMFNGRNETANMLNKYKIVTLR